MNDNLICKFLWCDLYKLADIENNQTPILVIQIWFRVAWALNTAYLCDVQSTV